jgi:hypothetical protein
VRPDKEIRKHIGLDSTSATVMSMGLACEEGGASRKTQYAYAQLFELFI